MGETDNAVAPGASSFRVVPLKPIDQRMPVGVLRTLVFFVVRSVLDERLLRVSLDSLIRNHLPILGARIKPAEKSGGLDNFVYPEKFLDDAFLFAWSTRNVDTTLEESSLLPNVSSTARAVTWGRPISEHQAAWTPSTWPLERGDDGPETPLLLIHLTSYEDATVLSVNIPHALADQKGLASMMEAWLAVAHGREPPAFIHLEPTSLNGPTDLPREDLRRKGHYRLKTKSEHIRTIMGLVPDLIQNRDETRRLLFLSASVIAKLRDRCNIALEQKHGPQHVVLTNGDIMTSLLAKVTLLEFTEPDFNQLTLPPKLSHLDKKKTKHLSIGETVNGMPLPPLGSLARTDQSARGRHPALPAKAHYLHNCPAYAVARIKYSCTTPLADIARAHRLAVNETAKLAGIERSFAVTAKVFEGARAIPMGEPGDIMYHVTNWSSAWHNVDFTPVVRQQEGYVNGKTPSGEAKGTSMRDNSLGQHTSPMLVFGHAVGRRTKVRRLHAPVFCKADGGYWVDYACSTKNMALVDKLLACDPMLETV